MSKLQAHKSHFGQLLFAFRVSGRELADALHIDSSLVSKWKNNKRSLKGNSPMLESILDYFLALDSPSGYSTLITLLSPEYTNLNPAEPKQLKTALKRWLLSTTDISPEFFSLSCFMGCSKKGKEQSHLEFKGNEGKRDAILGLLKAALLLPPKQELWCFMQDTGLWFTEDESYASIWEEANLDFLANGNSIHIIHVMDRQYHALAKSMLAWLPLYLTGRVTPHFASPHTSNTEICKSVILLKDQVLLYQLAPEDNSLETTTLAIESPVVLEEAFRMIQIPFRYSLPLFTPYYLNDHSKYAQFLSQMVNLDEEQYVFMRFPFVNVISLSQIQEILEMNEVEEKIKRTALKACQILKTDARKNSGNHFRYLIPKSMLEMLLTQDKIMLDTLSFFSGKPLFITNSVFRSLLRKLNELLVSESHKSIHEIALLEDIEVKQLGNLNMFIKKNTCLSIFNTPEHFGVSQTPFLLTTTESPIILSLFMLCDQIWKRTLPQKREKTYVARHLQIMTETIFPAENTSQ